MGQARRKSTLLKARLSDQIKIGEPPWRAAHFFDNPKTNLTYEKNLYIFRNKYRAKHNANINTVFITKKAFSLIN
jgi:hypothetical protein